MVQCCNSKMKQVHHDIRGDAVNSESKSDAVKDQEEQGSAVSKGQYKERPFVDAPMCTPVSALRTIACRATCVRMHHRWEQAVAGVSVRLLWDIKRLLVLQCEFGVMQCYHVEGKTCELGDW